MSGKKIIEGLHQALAHAKGDETAATVTTVAMSEPVPTRAEQYLRMAMYLNVANALLALSRQVQEVRELKDMAAREMNRQCERAQKAEAERDAALLALSRQVEDGGEWRTKLAEQCGKTLKAEAERDAAYAEGCEAMRDAAALKCGQIAQSLGFHGVHAHDCMTAIRALPLPQRR